MKTIQEFYNKEIENFKEQVVMMVKDMVNEFGGVDPIMMALVIKDNKVSIAVLGGLTQLFSGDDEMKLKAAELMREFNKELKPMAIAFASEAYIATAPIGKTVIDDDGVYLDDSFRPSVNPDSKECLMISFETFKDEGVMYWEMIKMGDVTDLKLIEDLNLQPKADKNASGVLTNLLEENYSELAELIKNNNISLN
jgi:hypothetical protein